MLQLESLPLVQFWYATNGNVYSYKVVSSSFSIQHYWTNIALYIFFFDILGTISANGITPSASNHGGGSGGSILITTKALEGSGQITVNGGSGSGGGGSGGRLAIYWHDREWWFGQLQAYGGSSVGNGGAGTVYLQVCSLLVSCLQSIPFIAVVYMITIVSGIYRLFSLVINSFKKHDARSITICCFSNATRSLRDERKSWVYRMYSIRNAACQNTLCFISLKLWITSSNKPRPNCCVITYFIFYYC